MLPLSPAKIEAVSAQMCQLRYRSFTNYLAAVKKAHITSPITNGRWEERLAVAGRDCTRAVLRGIGPAKQCGVFEGGLAAVCALKLGVAPLVTDGPIGPGRMMVIGTFFLLREVEASLLLWKSVVINRDTQTVWIHLAASKTDPLALSVWRYWGCVCSAGATICPYHSAIEQDALLTELVKRVGKSADDVPFFPTCTGRVVAKERVVLTFERIAQQLGESLTDDLGRRRFTGHLLRVQGARELATAGIEIFKIQLLARWRSPIVLRYAQEAPLASLTADFNMRRQAQGLSELISVAKSGDATQRKQLENIEASLIDLIVREGELRDRLEEKEAPPVTSAGDFVINEKSGCWHERASDKATTKCGWAYAGAPHALADRCRTSAWHDVCDRCMPLRRRALYRSMTKRRDADPESADE